MTDGDQAPSASQPIDQSSASPEASAPPRKVAPEALVLRAAPARAIRFKRSVILGTAIVILSVVLAAAWFALKPHKGRSAIGDDRQETAIPSSSDALAKAPTSYSEVPKLGPPLPGDLGKPILEHELASSPQTNDPVSHRVDQEREQQAAEQKAAQESALLAQTAGRAGGPSNMAATKAAPPAVVSSDGPSALTHEALNSANKPNMQSHKVDFIAARDTDPDVNPHPLAAPSSRFTLSAGSLISASLITGLRSDLPGLVVAQVTQNIYDSATGSMLLLPQGSRLIGSYDSVVAFGQRRALLVWQRIILPDGSSIRIDNVPATDASGYSGLADKVDFHTWSLLKGVVLSTLLGVSSDLSLSGQGDLVQAIRMSTQDSASRAGDQITQRNLQIQPTITIRPGSTVDLVVHRDLLLVPWIEGSEQ